MSHDKMDISGKAVVRKPYTRPVLTRQGTLVELTRITGGGITGIQDGPTLIYS